MFRLTVSDVFFIRGRGTVVTGQVQEGIVRVGDEVRIGDRGPVRVDGIEAFRKRLDQAQAGDNIGLLLTSINRSEVKAGEEITSVGDQALGELTFELGGRQWRLQAESDAWYCSEGGGWKHALPPG